MEAKRIYEFGPFRLEPAERRLMRDETSVPLTPKCFDLLLIFVENSDHLIGKEELIERLWPDQIVEEANLSFNISTLRKALGQAPNGESFIETVPKKGFRFVAHVEERLEEEAAHLQPRVDKNKQTPPSRARRFPLSLKIVVGLITTIIVVYFGYGVWARRVATPVSGKISSIAVLPFKPLNSQSRFESLEMGMAEALITKLSNVKELVVRPIGSVRKYTDIQQDPIQAGQDVQADAVLDGSIQKEGDQVRVSVRLLNVKTGGAIWADQFDTGFTDILKVQDSISERVIQALTLRLSTKEREQLNKHDTDNPEAYQLYLQGNYLATKQTGDRGENLRKALDYYQQAVQKDPKFAKAYIGISEFYISEGTSKIPSWERLSNAKAAILRALEIDSDLAEAHVARAELAYQYEFDWLTAGADFKRAIDLNPNSSYFRLAHSWYLMCQGQFDEAEAELDKAQELEPAAGFRANKTKGIVFLFRRQYDKSIAHYQKMREIEPGGIHRNQWSMSVMYQQLGMHSEAVEQFLEDGRLRMFLEPEESERLRKVFKETGWPGFERMRIDLLEQKSKKQNVAPTLMAGVYALADQKDLAFAWLEKAIDAHDGWIALIKIQPAYDNLRSDPRYTKVLARMNLTP